MKSFFEKVLNHQGCYEAEKQMKELQDLLERKDALSLAIYQQGKSKTSELVAEFEKVKAKIKQLRKIMTGSK